jgi:hypothetical protein
VATAEQAPHVRRPDPPDWSPVAEDGGPPRSGAAAVVARAVVGLAVAAVLWWLGHRIPATVLVGVVSVLTAASLASPAVAAAVGRVVAAIERVAGLVLSFVLLGAVQLLVFTPLALVLRLVRHDPLALGRARDAPSLWRETPRRPGRPLHRRQFTYERPVTTAQDAPRGRLPLLRLRAAAGLVVLVLLADLAVGLVLHQLDRTSEAPSAGERASLLFRSDLAAGRDEPWVGALAREIDEVWYGKRFDPFLGWTLPDHRGPLLQVSQGVRRSYRPAPGPGRPIDVFFFGGSTTFGLFQRDEHTIPSEVARLAEADGLRLRVSNHGRMAYTNWQETLLLSELVAGGVVPDVAVFYDGANEILTQFRNGPHLEPGHQNELEYARRIGFSDDGGELVQQQEGSRLGNLSRSWRDVSAATWVTRRIRGAPTEQPPSTAPLTSPWVGDQRQQADVVGRSAAALHARGVGVARRLGDGYGFRTAFFWQPFLYTKPLVAGEEPARGSLGTDAEAWTKAYGVARDGLASRVADLSDALDGVRTPIMYDFVHTNEEGARVVARALYARLEPVLRQAARERSP